MVEAVATEEGIIDLLQDIFRRSDFVPYASGNITMSKHHLVTAAVAEQAGAPAHVVAAALLHDIGHYGTDLRENCRKAEKERALDSDLDVRHPELGAEVLEPYFGPEVTEPIRLHVQAKRYLSATESGYMDKLGLQRVHTLKLQGGPMPPEEVGSFEAKPHFEVAVALRRFEDESHLPKGESLPDFEHFRPLLESLLRK